jgi:aspartate-semialdehyde dehydrogenase
MSLWRRERDPLVREAVGTKIEVGVLGATGTVGQQLIALLENHPWFQATWLAASERSAGHRYRELPWRLPGKVPNGVADRKVETLKPGGAPHMVFSALDAAVAGDAERAFAGAGHYVFSNARNHRMDSVVPLVIPEVNPEHVQLLDAQRRQKRWGGAIITNPNCSTIFLALALGALRDFEVRRVMVTTLQALSGAGYPGVASMDSVANVIPWIEGEEDKIETETQKILGRLAGNSIEAHPMRISAQVSRVPVLHGHTEMVSVEFAEKASIEQIAEAFREFSGAARALRLPSAPAKPIVVHEEQNRPQPRLDADGEHGMAVHVGRLRKCQVLDCKFVLVGHNTIRGAAGAAILNAELILARSLFGGGQATS